MFFLKSSKSFLVLKLCLYQHFEAFYELIVLWFVLQTAAQIVKGLPMANSASGQYTGQQKQEVTELGYDILL